MTLCHINVFDDEDKAVRRVIAYQKQNLSTRLIRGIELIQLEKLNVSQDPAWISEEAQPYFVVIASDKPITIPPPPPDDS
jgi:uncharacterized protein YfaT (DUF1175 family)